MQGQKWFTPKKKEDYLPLLGWMIGKRFAYVLAAGLILSGGLMLFLLGSFQAVQVGHRYRVFDYDSWILKFYKGNAAIRADAGYIAYVGQVKGGTANGEGTLYYENGAVLYEGDFSDGKYHGSGKLYHAGGSLIYEGQFSRNGIVYEELVGRKTEEVAEKYQGTQELYSKGQTLCVYMSDIDAAYYAEMQEKTLDEEWMTSGVYVLKPEFPAGDSTLCKKEELKDWFGEAEYTGTTAVKFQDAAAIRLYKRLQGETDLPGMTMEETLKDVYTVTEFQPPREMDIITYGKDGFFYTFFGEQGTDEFSFYLIELES